MPKNQPQPLVIRMADYPVDFPQIQAIRYAVFQVEQGVDAALEFDGRDAAAQHILALWQGQPVGTARLRWLDTGHVKIERVAVLQACRGQGIGKAIMLYILDYLVDDFADDLANHGTVTPVYQVQIHAQIAVQDFYERLGFTATGDRFLEAGIPHITMHRTLRSPA